MTREHWGSRLGFILAAAGSAVGLGNVWKFPYLVGQNGGAAFVITYLVLVLSIGAAGMLAEMAIGRAAQKNPVGAFAALKGGAWPVVGYIGVITGFLILGFYSVIGGWTIAYTVKMLDGTLTTAGVDFAKTFGGFVGDAVEPLVYHGVFMLLTALVVLKGVSAGIERWNKILMPALLILLAVLIVRAVTLPGAMAGVDFYLRPDFSKITADTVLAALSQAFFSLSIGMGAMLTYGSYLGRDQNMPKATVMVIGLDTGVAILAGLIVMPAVFALGMEPGAGPGLTFITLPGVFQQMPLGALFGAAFFLLLLFAALTSSVSLLEVPVSYLMDELKVSRQTAVITLAGGAFLLGVPSSLSLGIWADLTVFGLGFLDLLDFITSKLLMPVGGLLMCLFAGWVIWPVMVREATNDGAVRFRLLAVWGWVLKVLAPLAIAWILVKGLIG